MTDISEFADVIKAVDIEKCAKNAISNNLQPLKLYNIEQLRHGLTSEGKKIGKYRGREYSEKKNYMNPLAGFGNIDLILEGDFSENISAKVQGEEVVFDSGDWKSESLQERFPKVLGITDENTQEYGELFLQDAIVDQIQSEIDK